MEKELSPVVKQQITKTYNDASGLVISSQEQLVVATDILSRVKTAQKEIKAEKEKILAPLLESTKATRAFFAPYEIKCEEAEQTIKTKMIVYQNAVQAKAEAEAAKIAAKVEAGSMKFETAAKKIDAIETVAPVVSGDRGTIKFRTVKKVIVEDEAKIPRKYLVPDFVAIRKDALAGVEISGVKVVEEKTIAAQ